MDFFHIVGYSCFLTYASPSLMLWIVLCFIMLEVFSLVCNLCARVASLCVFIMRLHYLKKEKIMLEAFGFLRLSVDTLLYFSPYRFMTLTEITKMLVLLSSLQSILLSETACLMPSLICFYLHGILRLNGESTNSFSACLLVTAEFGGIIRLLVIPFIEKVYNLSFHSHFCCGSSESPYIVFCGSTLLSMLQLYVIFLFTKKLICSLNHAKNHPIACLFYS